MARQQCPKGTICFSWSMFSVLVILAVFLFVMIKPITSLQLPAMHNQLKQYNSIPRQHHQEQQPTYINIVTRGGDDRYTRAPEPIRRPMFGQLPAIATRGGYGDYQQLGVVERKDGTYYPLFGRRTYNSDRFNYYTRTDTYNPVQLPINFNKRDCTDDTGCNEISSGDDVRINGNEEAKVKLYTSSIMQ
jgi:hypothetical protein